MSSAERQQLVSNIIVATNARLAASGIQIGASGFQARSTASIQSLDSGLVDAAGKTYLQAVLSGLNPHTSRWGALGVAATDPSFGLALDVFLVEVDQGNPGAAAVHPALKACVFEGAGASHGIVLALKDSVGTTRPASGLGYILAHEMGHAMGLLHTTDQTLTFDLSPDTPHGVAADYDVSPKDGTFGPTEASQAHPDFGNLMYPYVDEANPPATTTLTQHQAAIMRSYLAVQKH